MNTKFTNIKSVLAFCGMLLVLSNLKIYAQDTTSLSLQNIIQIVDSTYPEIIKYDARINSILSRAEGARSQMPPQFSFGLSQFPYNPAMLKERDSPENQAGITFGGEQMFTNPFKLKAKQNYISSLAEIEKSNVAWTRNRLRLETKFFYYTRFVAEKKVTVLQESKALLNLLINTAEEKYKVNQAELSTIFKSRGRLSEIGNMEYMYKFQITESNIGLNTLMSREVNTPFLIDTSLKVNPQNYVIADTSFLNRSNIVAIDRTVNSIRLNQKYMASFRKPDFGIGAEHMQMFGMPNRYSLMGTVTIPIAPWYSKMYRSEVKAMEFEIKEMQLEKETMRLEAKRMVNDRVAMLNSEYQQLLNYENSILPSYQKNFDAALIAYRQNTGNLFVVLDAWDMLLMKRIEYLEKYESLLKLEASYQYEIESK